MKTLSLDTNAYSDFKRGLPSVIEALARADRILVPIPVLAELRVGFRGGHKEQQNLLELEQFLSSPRVSLSTLGEQTAILFAEIYGTLKKRGTPIPLNDVWIAASSLEHGAILLSADNHFSQVEGLLRNIPM